MDFKLSIGLIVLLIISNVDCCGRRPGGGKKLGSGLRWLFSGFRSSGSPKSGSSSHSGSSGTSNHHESTTHYESFDHRGSLGSEVFRDPTRQRDSSNYYGSYNPFTYHEPSRTRNELLEASGSHGLFKSPGSFGVRQTDLGTYNYPSDSYFSSFNLGFPFRHHPGGRSHGSNGAGQTGSSTTSTTSTQSATRSSSTTSASTESKASLSVYTTESYKSTESSLPKSTTTDPLDGMISVLSALDFDYNHKDIKEMIDLMSSMKKKEYEV